MIRRNLQDDEFYDGPEPDFAEEAAVPDFEAMKQKLERELSASYTEQTFERVSFATSSDLARTRKKAEAIIDQKRQAYAVESDARAWER